MIKPLVFKPFPGLSSPHAQMVFSYFFPAGKPAPSSPFLVPLYDGDQLVCQVATPPKWRNNHPTVIMLHGLGGDENSPYLIRMSRKFYHLGYRAVRVNLRGSGPGSHLSSLPYNGGNSLDIVAVLRKFKSIHPTSPIILAGFSLGANIILKMAGELGESAHNIVDHIIAVCPPLDFANTMTLLAQRSNRFYHRYYLKSLLKQSEKWIKPNQKIHSVYDYDSKVTAPLWGYENAVDYYHICSCLKYLSGIRVCTQILFSADDPFVNYRRIEDISLPSSVSVYVTEKGGHMGFFGKPGEEGDCFWMDQLLLRWSQIAV